MKTMTLTADIDRVNEVVDFVSAQLDMHDAPMKVQMQIAIAVEEIYCNIAHHAYAPGTDEAEISVCVEGDPPAAVIRFADRGTPFNPLARQDPDITLGIEERSIGGLGIFMVKKSMDEVAYAFEDGQNILTIRKRL